MAVLALSQLDPVPTVCALVATAGLLAKLILADAYQPQPPGSAGADGLSVTVIIPVYNEDPTAFAACLDSVLAQTWPPAQVFVVDDGSPSPECADIALDRASRHPNLQVHCDPHNRGKRHALAVGIRNACGDIVATVDSDTVLAPDAIERGLEGFTDETVLAVSGDVRALNRDRNMLTRLIDLQYGQSFFFQRAAYSALGSVLCCCGSMSFYRRGLLTDVVDDFVAQRFLGVEVQYGDDRRLTNYALLHGQVRFQSTSIAFTMVPDRWAHFIRQQLRWVRSFVRESLWLLTRRPWMARTWMLALFEVLLWGPLYAMFTAALILTALHHRDQMVPLYLLVFFAIATARCTRAIASRIPFGENQRGPRVLDAMVFGVLHLLLAPVLFFLGCLTLRQTGWGTRAKVEVRLNTSTTANPRRSATT